VLVVVLFAERWNDVVVALISPTRRLRRRDAPVFSTALIYVRPLFVHSRTKITYSSTPQQTTATASLPLAACGCCCRVVVIIVNNHPQRRVLWPSIQMTTHISYSSSSIISCRIVLRICTHHEARFHVVPLVASTSALVHAEALDPTSLSYPC